MAFENIAPVVEQSSLRGERRATVHFVFSSSSEGNYILKNLAQEGLAWSPLCGANLPSRATIRRWAD